MKGNEADIERQRDKRRVGLQRTRLSSLLDTSSVFSFDEDEAVVISPSVLDRCITLPDSRVRIVMDLLFFGAFMYNVAFVALCLGFDGQVQGMASQCFSLLYQLL